MAEALIETFLGASLHMYNVLHGFRNGRKAGTAIIISRIDQDPIFLVCMDHRKAYNTVDRELLLVTLEGYGAGPWMCGILETFWEFQQVVLSQNGFHGLAFPDTRGKL